MNTNNGKVSYKYNMEKGFMTFEMHKSFFHIVLNNYPSF